ncbi:hypothetical protein CROQUDRAFT_672820 [Cronartium quercuum f. sp. fusiforme G11]|uniref:MFS general substrate transporter n=1 Tax=Cronartium quercuum f. sp. fusiforme G11 TaxID=708437 RepID=A0A9P6NGG0_9BASI|nr:hypothetical protein CROQUDRAFT_672820 [Cronartium quercuum f. sp. fusiforme G11]
MRRKVVRKLDFRTIPILSLLYLACFIDRTNIGNAKIAGLENDLGLTGIRYNISIAVFFVTYIIVEIPSNHLMRRFGAKAWLPVLVCGWGLFEGGLLPGMILHLSTLYRKDELQFRIGCLFSCAALSGAFGGLLAYGIESMNGVGGKPAWAWIFILEGLGTIVIALLSWCFLFSSISSATFLTLEEKTFQDNVPSDKRLSSFSTGPAVEAFEFYEVKRGLLEPQAWIIGLASMFLFIGLYSFSFFLVIAVAFLSDKFKLRGPIILALLPITIVGYIIAIMAEDPKIRYASVFLMAAGIYPSAPGFFTLLPNNTSGMTKRATVTALQIMIMNVSGFIAPFLYTTDSAPRFVRGHTIALVCICFSWALTACNVLYCLRENRARKAGLRNVLAEDYYRQVNEGKTRAPIGDRDPNFLFTL